MIHLAQDYMRIQDPDQKIPETEPVFLLRAQDATSVDTLRFWIKQQRKLLRKIHKADPKPDLATVLHRKKAVDLAVAHLHRMDDWPHKKIADV
jgi:hypothetical protein